MIPWFTGSLMRATALSSLCGIKAASISSTVRGGALGGNAVTIQLLTFINRIGGRHLAAWQGPEWRLNQQRCHQTPGRLGGAGWYLANVIKHKGFATVGVDHSRSSDSVFDIIMCTKKCVNAGELLPCYSETIITDGVKCLLGHCEIH